MRKNSLLEMRKTVLLVGLMAFVSLGSATSIQSENVTIDLEDETVEKNILFDEVTSDRITYIVTNNPVYEYYVEIEEEEAECEFTNLEPGGEISCITDNYENVEMFLSYSTSGLINSQNDANVFRYTQNIYRTTESHRLKVILPQGTALINQEEASIPVVDPEFGEVGSEGRRIHVEWEQSPSITGPPLSFQIVYEDLNTDYRNAIIALVMILLVAGFARFYLRYKTDSEASSIFDSLTEDQKSIVEMLKENEGAMLQKDIVDNSEYSKAKISGLISELEELDLVNKEKEGRSNRVDLDKELM